VSLKSADQIVTGAVGVQGAFERSAELFDLGWPRGCLMPSTITSVGADAPDKSGAQQGWRWACSHTHFNSVRICSNPVGVSSTNRSKERALDISFSNRDRPELPAFNLLIHATSAAFLGFSWTTGRRKIAWRTGFTRMPLMAAIYSFVRTSARPPWMARWPRHRLRSRLKSASLTNALNRLPGA